jgi:hypothetical protein
MFVKSLRFAKNRLLVGSLTTWFKITLTIFKKALLPLSEHQTGISPVFPFLRAKEIGQGRQASAF